ncbi:fimbria/pilus outer membrane usher protein [Pseudomonas sp. NPDC087803]|uniref:fimbria/pilus outer membrane usher protein n=1 Tax=Pseudomonas sp. NPDC087803 TaxID=3364448 RepID=UPI0038180B70
MKSFDLSIPRRQFFLAMPLRASSCFRAMFFLILGIADVRAMAAEATLPAAASHAEYEDAEFSSSFLVGNAKTMDMSRYQKGNPVLPGFYDLDIYINGKQVTRAKVEFVEISSSNIAQACLTLDAMHQFGIDTKSLKVFQGCRTLSAVMSNTVSYADISEQKLYLQIPQAALRRTARGYVEPDYWDPGITAGKLDYNLNYFNSQNDHSGSTDSAYLSLRGGFNFGLWQFRHNANVNWTNGSKSTWNRLSTYVQRPVGDIKSTVSLGEFNTKGAGFDSVAVRGVSLASDERMFPDSQIGFAPTIRSFARSNARVEVWQNDTKIYQTTVTPGNFVIDDLYPTGYGGDLNVVVTEADGGERRFDVPYSSVTNLMRPGRAKYDLVSGKLYNQVMANDAHLLQGTVYYGLNNYLTGYGGLQFSEGFQSGLLGLGVNTTYGAFSLDLTQENTQLSGGYGSTEGRSLKIAYSKMLSETKTNFTLAAYRYSSSKYMTLTQAVDAREWVNAPGFREQWLWEGHERDRFDLSIDQPVGNFGSLFLTGSTRQTWGGGNDSSRQFEIGFNGNAGDISYSISASRNNDEFLGSQTQYFVSLNIPLGNSGRSPTLSTQYTGGPGQGSTLRNYLSGVADEAGRWSYGITQATDTNTSSSSSLNTQYRGNRSTLRGSFERGGDYKSTSFGSNGSVLAHSGGVTFSPNTGETIGLVSAPGGEGASVGGLSGLVVDKNGYAIVPSLSPYRMNNINLDPKGSSMNVAFQNTTKQVAPYAGAIVRVDFETRVGQSAVIHVSNGKSLNLTFGADVRDQEGNVVGVVGQGNNLFVQGVGDNGSLTVSMQDDSSCEVIYQLAAANAGNHDIMRAQAPCVVRGGASLSSR